MGGGYIYICAYTNGLVYYMPVFIWLQEHNGDPGRIRISHVIILHEPKVEAMGP